MPVTLKNTNLSLTLDRPGETYRMSRFDWNGFISSVSWKGILLTGQEKPSAEQNNSVNGYGLHNEFGITDPVGFSDCAVGDWYIKIGVGLLKKDAPEHDFFNPHEVKPLEFKVRESQDSVLFSCIQPEVRGYAYRYDKTITLQDNRFIITYTLVNEGQKDIITDEYTHNFIAFDKNPVNPGLEIRFPFPVKEKLFIKTVNPEGLILWQDNCLKYTGTPEEQYFFSNLTGGVLQKASWTIQSGKHNLALTENGNFETSKVNLWGWRHVVSPELFRSINLCPGESTAWTRTYEVTEPV